MNTVAAAFALAPALALGSFLNVVAVRVPEHRSILRPPSSCGYCRRAILWRDNIPLASYVLLRGRCRHCHGRISALYPLVEAVTAMLVAGCVAVFGPTPYAALAAGFCAALVTLSVIDVRHGIVPDRIVLPASAAIVVLHTLLDPRAEWLLAALAASGFLFVVALACRERFGMGEVKLALLPGAMLGATVPLALTVGVVAALVPAAMSFRRHGADARRKVPFAPFLSLGAVVALFAGQPLLGASLDLV